MSSKQVDIRDDDYQLPDSPIDQMEIIAYRIDSLGEGIKRLRYVYHLNTPWSIYSPKDKGGADIIDDWVCYSNGSDRADGRRPEWSSLQSYLQRADVFATFEEAALALLPILKNRIEWHRHEAIRIEALVDAVGGKGNDKSRHPR